MPHHSSFPEEAFNLQVWNSCGLLILRSQCLLNTLWHKCVWRSDCSFRTGVTLWSLTPNMLRFRGGKNCIILRQRELNTYACSLLLPLGNTLHPVWPSSGGAGEELLWWGHSIQGGCYQLSITQTLNLQWVVQWRLHCQRQRNCLRDRHFLTHTSVSVFLRWHTWKKSFAVTVPWFH